MPADPLAATLAAQVRSHLAALTEIAAACHGQRIAALDAAYWELSRAIYRLEVAVVAMSGVPRSVAHRSPQGEAMTRASRRSAGEGAK